MEKNNINQESQIIGADIGRGYVKGYTVYNGEAAECCFKSIISLGREIDFSEHKDPIYLEVDGEEYFAGVLAEVEGYSPTANNMESKVTLTAEKLLYTLLDKLAVTDNIRLVLGVPNKAYNKRTLTEVLEAYKGKKIKIMNNVTKQYKNILIEDITIFRESDAALLWELRDRTTTNKPIGMVTVGFRTTEFTYFDKGMKFNDKKSKSLELGNKTALEYVQRELNDKYNLSKELFEIDSNTGDYDKLKEKGYRILSEKVAQEVDSYWINTEEMDIYFGGGTAQRMKIYNGTLVEAPQMATAKGLYIVGTKVFK
ncbi:MAG: ParM/StbA family protein [Clostridium sp.]|uniref:ParM/StbA family protein n=1 Tax=Clostridium sp. TaxID=1506 RepID=UPI002A913ED4|nr:ParM/StbA family protein [Clostridium sp.]MDY6228791.1 ParM/StbA family protein [Clostridium sp.]